MLLLAGPGVLISTTLVASFAIFGMGYDWDWPTGLTFGAMVSATDPVAVVALLQELGAPKQLSILIEGESLFNDGTALVIFTVFKDMMTGAANRNVGEIVGFFARLSIGGPSLGLVRVLRCVPNSPTRFQPSLRRQSGRLESSSSASS